MFVLVHGGHAASWIWDDVRPLLHLPSLAVDLPGHGARPGDLRSLCFAECVRSIRAELPGEPKFILVGHSLSAAVVLALADSLRERVAHIVIIAGPVPRPGVSITGSFPWLMRVASRVVLSCSGPVFTQSPGMAKRTMLNGLDAGRAQTACARFTPESRSLVQEPLHWSGRPPAPCTYIRCLRDRGALSPQVQERMAANLGSGVRIVSLDTCHYPMLESPEQVARALNEVADEQPH
ncbi:MAG: alpha/beta hydrolase fold [Spartobacteria bacterium]|nr:alpha/beta hydrolase fold [Spartobacteria bacterium]